MVYRLDKLDKLSKVEVANNLKKLGAERILKVIDDGDFSKYKFYGEILNLMKLEKCCILDLIVIIHLLLINLILLLQIKKLNCQDLNELQKKN